ncbi:MAG: histidine kinase dimerization/phosphoacceptor domain -containing protein [bacterium]
MEHVFEEAVRSIRQLTGYDRVMLYQFDDDGHGSVEAEDKQAELHSYLGNHFPASDIPEPARQLYRKNNLRYIPRVDYDPVPIVGPPGKRQSSELDLTYSSLRNVPLVHRKYLKNMDVGASISVSLMVDGDLWGLIACHAVNPTPVSHPVRHGCEIIGQAISQHIYRLKQEKKERSLEQVKQFRQGFRSSASDMDDFFDQLKRLKSELLSLLDADAFLCKIDDQFLCLTGDNIKIPENSTKNLIEEQLKEQDSIEIESITGDIRHDWSESSALSGLLAYRIGHSPDSFCAWVRPEYQRIIQWGGDPRTPVDVDEDGQLSPRNSFEEWTQIVEERCRPWTEVDTLTARQLFETFEDSLLEVRANQLREANKTKETLMQEIHHRVKNNFNLAASLVGLQKRQIEDGVTIQQLDEIYNRLQSMSKLHEVLYTEDNIQDVRIKKYAGEILENIRKNHRTSANNLNFETSLEDFVLSTSQALYTGLILSELVSNSLEHGLKQNKDLTVTVEISQTDREVQLLVRDDGPGWDDEFDPFQSDSFGLKIVRTLIEDQMDGMIQVDGQNGASFNVHFPVKEESNRYINFRLVIAPKIHALKFLFWVKTTVFISLVPSTLN